MATFEGYDRRINKIEGVLKEYGFTDLDQMAQYVKDQGVDVDAVLNDVIRTYAMSPMDEWGEYPDMKQDFEDYLEEQGIYIRQ